MDTRVTFNLTANHVIPQLYDSLAEDIVRRLEHFFRLTIEFNPDQTDRELQSLPESCRRTTALVAGYAHRLTVQERIMDGVNFLSRTFSDTQDISRTEDESLLLRSYFAYFMICHSNDFNMARDCMRQLQDKLKDARFESVDAIQVACLSLHLRIIKQAQDQTPNFRAESYLDIFRPHGAGLASVRQFREYLLSSSRLRQALLIHDWEEDFLTGVAAKAAVSRSLLDAIKKAPSSPRLLTSTFSKYASLLNCYRMAKQNAFEEVLEEVAAFLKLAKDNPSLPSLFFQTFFRLLKLWNLSFLSEQTFEDVRKVVDLAFERKWYRIALVGSSCCMPLPEDLFARDASFDQRPVIAARMEQLLSELGYAQMLATFSFGHSPPIDKASSAAFIQRCASFDARHAGRESWKQRITRQRQLMLAHETLGHPKESRMHKTLGDVAMQEATSFWALDHPVPAQGHELADQLSVRLRLRTEQIETVETYWFEDFRDGDFSWQHPETHQVYYGVFGEGVVGGRTKPLRTLLSWILHDLQAGQVTDSEVAALLDINPNAETGVGLPEVQGYIQALSVGALYAKLYLQVQGEPVTFETWRRRIELLKTWLLRTNNFPELQQRMMPLELHTLRLEQLDRFKLSRTLQGCEQAVTETKYGLKLLKELNLGERTKAAFSTRDFWWRIAYASDLSSKWNKQPEWTDAMQEEFWEAGDALGDALSLLDAPPPTDPGQFNVPFSPIERGMLWYTWADVWYGRFLSKGTLNVVRTLNMLRLSEGAFRDRQPASYKGNSLADLRAYLGVLENAAIREIYPRAVHILSVTNPSYQTQTERERELWDWIQAAKCRGLRTLGRFITMDRTYNRAFLKTTPELEPAQEPDANEPQAFNTSELALLDPLAGRRILFVDYYANLNNFRERSTPILMVCQGGQSPTPVEISEDFTVGDLDQWSRDLRLALLQGGLDMRPEEYLQYFEPLVRPLMAFCEPGDVVVLSASGPLHGVPLHAVVVDRQPLICRNPVVYTDSLRSLWYAVYDRHIAPLSSADGPRSNAVFWDPATEHGAQSTSAIARRLGTEVNGTDHSFTKTSFLASLGNANGGIVHYHAHATEQKDDPFKQALRFRDPELHDGAYGALTVEDLLDRDPTERDFHLTMLGCSSGVTVQASSNESIGLVPALFYAGASSVISALWKVLDADAARFGDAFYDDLDTQRQENAERAEGEMRALKLVDMARAMQAAVLRLLEPTDGKRPALRHWAGFVFNGWWMIADDVLKT